jgi:hypothetical protein
VDEKEAARNAKAKFSDVRKLPATRQLSEKVYVKHGSRSNRSEEKTHGRGGSMGNGASGRAQQPALKKRKQAAANPHQPSLQTLFAKAAKQKQKHRNGEVAVTTIKKAEEQYHHHRALLLGRQSEPSKASPIHAAEAPEGNLKLRPVTAVDNTTAEGIAVGQLRAIESPGKYWACSTCTFQNHKPHAFVCEMCRARRVAEGAVH